MSSLSHFPLSSHKLFSPPFPSITPNCGVFHRHHLSICASAAKKPGASRKVKSDTDLCNDIREFLSAVGLPEGHVPSTKELSQHGRQDLSNIVRRRGYKHVKELLATSTKTNRKESVTEKGLTVNQDRIGQNEMVEFTANDIFQSSEDPINQIHLKNANGTSADFSSTHEGKSYKDVESSTSSSLQEKVTKFIQNGLLDAIEDNVKEQSNASSGERSNESSGHNKSRDDAFSSKESRIADCDEEPDIETKKGENQLEIDHLKFLLHQKELELSQLKEQIENEKLVLSHLQTKIEMEMNTAQKRISKKDAELHAAEQSLAELKEVLIEYWADGEIVEMAGSFNGWHHRIRMDPEPSRESKLWTTVLWLYPGIYEIKFVVDGHWRIDSQRESVMTGSIQNNILRVDG